MKPIENPLTNVTRQSDPEISGLQVLQVRKTNQLETSYSQPHVWFDTDKDESGDRTRYDNTWWKYFIVSKDLLKTITLLLAEV